MKIETPSEWKFRLKAQKIGDEVRRLFPSENGFTVTSTIYDTFVCEGHIEVCTWVREKRQDTKPGYLYLFAVVEKHTRQPTWPDWLFHEKKTVYYDAWMDVDDEAAFEPAKKLGAFIEELFRHKFEIVVNKEWL